MSLVIAAIAPHGGEIVPELAEDLTRMARTRAAMRELGRRFAAARPDTVVVLTPHGMVVQGAISIGAAPHAAGTLGDKPPAFISATFDTDLDLAQSIVTEAQRQSLPIAPVAARRGEDDPPIVALDWGALIPLWFAAHPLTEPRPQVVALAPDRSLPRETLVRCGVAIARAADASGKRVALIASCDQGHAHDPDGPYGFNPASAEHDRLMCDAIAANDLARLLEWPDSYLETAKVDAFWQTIMLAGALGYTPMRGELLSYEAPTYFGMAVAAYEPVL